MELWWRLRGWKRLRLTSADCPARLREISNRLPLEDISFPEQVTAEFRCLASDVPMIRVRDGERLETVEAGGLPHVLMRIRQWRRLAAFVLLLGALTVLLPTRVWFFRVEGNGELPERYILEQAEACGVRFGASRRELRSEQVKNRLLRAIPELRWAGVNTEGCTAVITVALRDEEQDAAEALPGDIVAVCDGVVTEVYSRTGTAAVKPGQAVRAGETLISGAADLGRTIRLDRADGEVYGLTRRELEAVLPGKTLRLEQTGRVERKFSLLIGKKYVNFSNDSGIFGGTCVKMRTVNYLTLPGGFRLPAALVTETRYLCEAEEVPREDRSELEAAARRIVRERMTAGLILEEDLKPEENRLSAVFECRELIGVFRPGVYMERDTNDGESGER